MDSTARRATLVSWPNMILFGFFFFFFFFLCIKVIQLVVLYFLARFLNKCMNYKVIWRRVWQMVNYVWSIGLETFCLVPCYSKSLSASHHQLHCLPAVSSLAGVFLLSHQIVKRKKSKEQRKVWINCTLLVLLEFQGMSVKFKIEFKNLFLIVNFVRSLHYLIIKLTCCEYTHTYLYILQKYENSRTVTWYRIPLFHIKIWTPTAEGKETKSSLISQQGSLESGV